MTELTDNLLQVVEQQVRRTALQLIFSLADTFFIMNAFKQYIKSHDDYEAVITENPREHMKDK